MRLRSDWQVLSSEELELLSAGQEFRRYSAGEQLYAMGQSCRGAYCVCAGTVAIRRMDGEGNSVLLQLGYPGDTLGYEALLTGEEHRANAEALGPSAVCFIARPTVDELLGRNPDLGMQFLKRAQKDLNDAHDKLVHHATLSNRGKFAHCLLILLNRYGRTTADGSRVMDLPVSRRDLASMIGTRHETLSRIISRMEGDGVAFFSGRSVQVPQLNNLVNEIRPQLVG